jgi:preprotein translocase subunit SecA
LMQRLGMKPGESIEHALVNRAIENSQRKVEAHNFDIRKHLLDFDDVANDQRRAIYGERNALMDADDISATIAEQRVDVMRETVLKFVPAQSVDEQWNLKGLNEELNSKYGLDFDAVQLLKEHPELDWEAMQERVIAAMEAKAAAKEAEFTPEVMRMAERQIMLQVMDSTWKEHLAKMDYLRQGIHLRGYAQKQPKQEYKRESFEMFELMINKVRSEVVGILSNVRLRTPEPEATEIPEDMRYRHPSMAVFAEGDEPQMVDEEFVLTPEILATTGRNDPCPCGSGKKFKQCHGQLA